jgi:hypothetical protein
MNNGDKHHDTNKCFYRHEQNSQRRQPVEPGPKTKELLLSSKLWQGSGKVGAQGSEKDFLA